MLIGRSFKDGGKGSTSPEMCIFPADGIINFWKLPQQSRAVRGFKEGWLKSVGITRMFSGRVLSAVPAARS
jgi:hypothetical protein